MKDSLKTRLALFLVPFMAYGPIITTASLVAITFSKYYYVTLIYVAYRIWDRNSPVRGGWTHHWARSFVLFMRDYFPCNLVAIDASLFDVSKNYIFCAHPHAIIPVGGILNFLSNAVKEQTGLECAIVGLAAFFHVPFMRELYLSMGASAGTVENLEYILQNRNGQAIVTWPGGVREAVHFAPRSMRVRTVTVQGMARLALHHGAQLVPVISFGDNDTFTLTTDDRVSNLRRVLTYLTEAVVKVRLPRFYGRGHLGCVHLRTPITTVVGKPIASQQLTDPSFEEVHELYLEYVKALKELFYTTRHQFGYGDVDIEFVVR